MADDESSDTEWVAEASASGETAGAVRAALTAAAALCAAEEYHAAHDPLEAVWLGLSAGDDERLLHGLIQFTAGVYHATTRNWSGAAGLGSSAADYLATVEESRGVTVGPIEAFCRSMATDPAVIERRSPPPIRIDGTTPTYETLSPPAVWAAAEAVATEHGYDEEIPTEAARFARADRSRGDTPEPFTRFLRAFLAADEHRPLAFERLTGHVERRQLEESDVAGLFE